MSRRSWGYLCTIGAAACWGVSGVVAKSLFNAAFDPLGLVVLRLTLSTALLAVTLSIVSPRRFAIHRRDVLALAVLGIGGMATNQATYFLAISATSVAVAIFLQYLAPVLVALAAIVLDRTRMAIWTLAALVAAMSGSALLLIGSPAGSLHVGPRGFLFGLASACCFAFYTIWSSRVVRHLDPWTVLFYGLLFATLVWNVLRPAWRVAAAPLALGTWAAILFIAVVGTLLPFGLFLHSLQRIPATHASITATLEPVVAGITAFLLLGEILTPVQIVGGACVVAAVGLVHHRHGTEP